MAAFVQSEAARQFAQCQITLGRRARRLLAVNMSRAELGEPGFVSRVHSVLEGHGVAPHCLQLETTKVLEAQDNEIQARLNELQALGFMLALDDFGTSNSSLASLHLLPLDTVTIDRSFTVIAASSHTQRVLIDATVRVARNLGMLTIAEGIEPADQHALLRDVVCNKGQGFFYCKPPKADALVVWVLSHELAEETPGLG